MNQLRRYRPLFLTLFAASFLMLITGCGNVQGDAETVLSVISLAFGTASAAVLLIPGVGPLISPLLAEGSAIVAQLQAQFKTFVADPTESAYQNVMAFVSQLNANLGQILAATGLPAALVTKLQSIFTVVQTQIQNWVNLVESLKKPGATTASAAIEARAALPGTALHAQLQTVHESASTFRAQMKGIVETPVGDETIDDAFTKANKF
jgi:hypothetical protein